MKNIAFIINLKSSRNNIELKVKKLQQTFSKSHFFFSKSKQETQIFIKKSWENTKTFVVVGGDGTVSSVASEIINTDKNLAIFPTGSGNGFAKETNFNQDINTLYKKLKNNKTTKIDTFLINQHFAINAAGIGFDAFVAKKFEQTKRGFWNYIKVCTKNYLSYKEINIKLKSNEDILTSDKYFFATIANSRQFGNNAYIAPNAKLNDGLIDIVLVKKIPLWRTLAFALQLFSKKIHKNPSVKTLQLKNTKIYANTDIWHIDGDHINIPSPVSIQIIEKSLNIIC